VADRIPFRVDVNNSQLVPCDMNSIRYVGTSWKKANSVFDTTPIGMDRWGQKREGYGVILSIWSESKNSYVAKRIKGIR
jgi:hypothetical protein